MIGYDSESEQIKHYRVDKMQNLSVTSDKRDGAEHFKNFDMAIYSKKTFAMFGGREETVTLRCANSLAGVIIDRFGQDTTFYNINDKTFDFHVRVQISPHFLTWIMNFGNKITVLSPDSVKDELVTLAKEIIELYK